MKSRNTAFQTVWKTTSRFVLPLIAAAGLGFAGQATAAPLAGTTIQNQASASYTDASNAPRTATSNPVTTIVQQVAGFTLVTSQTKTVAPGGTVYFSHTLTNTGNGNDTFGLTSVDANTGSITFGAGPTMYADANGDGLPDNFTALTTTGALAPSGAFNFVVAATIPGATANGANETMTITGTSGLDASTHANTDTINVTTAASINLVKAISVSSGPSPTAGVVYTLTYTNTGNSTATDLTITDTIPTGMTYVAGSALWSVTGAAALSDAYTGNAIASDLEGAGATKISFNYNITTAGVVTYVINSVGPGQSGTVNFTVDVNSGLAPQVIPNTANQSYQDGASPTPATVNGTSNTVNFTVLQSAAVAINDTVSTTDTDPYGTLNNDIIEVYSATQGATVVFDNVVHNNGNGTDTFNIDLYGDVFPIGTFPSGTSFLLYKADGVSPLVDTNGDTIPDTGPLATGATYHVFVKAILPTSATGGPYTVYKRATSVFNPLVSDTTTDRLAAIIPNSVDMTNNTARSDSVVAGSAASGNAATTGFGINATSGAALTAGVITNPTLNPGDAYTFALYINNTSTVPDSYDLLADQDGVFGVLNDMPAGWTTTFHLNGSGTCATVGAAVSNTGTINAGANTLICAVVTTPANQSPITQNIYFRAISPTSGSLDIKLDAVTVRTVRNIQITSNNAGQVFPGGSVVYTHIVTNNGNVDEGTVATGNGTTASAVVLTLADNLSAQGWTSVTYWDMNNDGVLDVNDPVLTDLYTMSGGSGGASLLAGLSIGESATVFVKVFSPSGAAINDINTTTITATTSGLINGVAAPAAVNNQDNTTVIAGQVRLTKYQSADILCDGYSDTGVFTTADLTTGMVPGACIRYRVVAINDGTANVTSLVLSDSTPANTTYHAATDAACTVPVAANISPAVTTSVGTASASAACGNTATLTATIGTLTPAQSATVEFGVRINP